MSDAETTAEQYDAMAAEYSAANDDESVYNSRYERPAMLRLLGDIAGQRVLDAGCGAGQLTAELIDRGASVAGIDVSENMISIARERVGDQAAFFVGSFDGRLPFEDASFDVVVASLALHYLRDWAPPLAEFRRVLRPGGRIVFSTHHPTMDWKQISPDDYFAKKQITETWTKRGKPFDVTFWRRSLSEMSREIDAAGLVIARIDEPMPDDSLAAIDAKNDAYLRTHPHFLFLTLRAA